MTIPVRSELSDQDFAHLHHLGERHGVTVGSLVAELVRRHLAGECLPPKQKSDGLPLAGEVVAQILALHGEGRSDMAIARELGITSATVGRYRNDAGLEPNVQNSRLPDSTVDRIRELNAEGVSDREIGRRLGIANQRVSKYRNSLGLPKNSKGGRPRATTHTYPLLGPAQAATDTREKTPTC